MRVIWLFYHFLELEGHIFLSKISQFLMFGNCDLSGVTSFLVKRALYYRKFPKISEVRRFPFGDSLALLQSLITRERGDTHIVLQHFELSFI